MFLFALKIGPLSFIEREERVEGNVRETKLRMT